MPTKITLDNKLVERLMAATDAATTQGAVEAAIEMYLRVRGQGAIRELFGKVEWEGNLEESRLGRTA